MLKKIKTALSATMPGVGKYKRNMVAWIDSRAKLKNTYSQHGEDLFVIEFFESKRLNKIDYVDVGANHPSDISNTYKLYRNGNRGIVIEPNQELIELHKKYRPNDIHLAVGCGESDEILEFNYSKTPVLSSFDKTVLNNYWKSEYLPVYKLDTIIDSIKVEKIHFLNVDVEGLDFEVLKGASSTLKKTYLVCVEANDIVIKEKIIELMIDHYGLR